MILPLFTAFKKLPMSMHMLESIPYRILDIKHYRTFGCNRSFFIRSLDNFVTILILLQL